MTNTKITPLYIGSKEDAQKGKKDALINSFQQIERWSETLPTNAGGYASLTGAGQSATPGALTQAGGFTINDGVSSGATGIAINSGKSITIHATSTGASASPGIIIQQDSTHGIQILTNNSLGGVTITDLGGGIFISQNGNGPITISMNSGNTLELFLGGGAGLKIVGLPTSSAGLLSGYVWNNSGVLNIV